MGLFLELDHPIVLPEVSIRNRALQKTLEAILTLEANQSMMAVPSALWDIFLFVVPLLLNQNLPHNMMYMLELLIYSLVISSSEIIYATS